MNTHRMTLESLLIVLLVCAAPQVSAQVAPRTGHASGTEAAVRTTFSRPKGTDFRFDHLRAGAIRTTKGWWNVQDFAHSLF